MDNQTLFNNAWQHFIVGDGQPAYNADNHLCWYRTVNGNRCAIGVSIPDAEYSEKLEHHTASELVQRRLVPSLAGADVNFAIELQWCHDHPAREGITGDVFKAQMRGHMLDLALKRSLTVPA